MGPLAVAAQRADFQEQAYHVAAELRRAAWAGRMPADVVKKLQAACIAVMKSDAAQRVVKHTFQPADYFADAAGFTKNLAMTPRRRTSSCRC